MRGLYLVSFLFSLVGIRGVGHMIAGAPDRATRYFLIGLIWNALGLFLIFNTLIAAMGVIPLHLLFAHFNALDAVRTAAGQ